MAKLTTQEIQKRFEVARISVRIGEIFRHYKGGVYVVTGLTLDTDTSTIRVSYMRVDGPGFDPVAENGIVFSRRIEEWTHDRFTRVEAG